MLKSFFVNLYVCFLHSGNGSKGRRKKGNERRRRRRRKKKKKGGRGAGLARSGRAVAPGRSRRKDWTSGSESCHLEEPSDGNCTIERRDADALGGVLSSPTLARARAAAGAHCTCVNPVCTPKSRCAGANPPAARSSCVLVCALFSPTSGGTNGEESFRDLPDSATWDLSVCMCVRAAPREGEKGLASYVSLFNMHCSNLKHHGKLSVASFRDLKVSWHCETRGMRLYCSLCLSNTDVKNCTATNSS